MFPLYTVKYIDLLHIILSVKGKLCRNFGHKSIFHDIERAIR